MKRYYELDGDDGFPPEEKYLYLLLYAPGYTQKFNEPIKGNTWLQKQMHALSKAVPKLNFEFDEYNFGAFSPSLETVQIQNEVSDFIYQPYGDGPLELTSRGLRIAKKLWNESKPEERELISELKNFLNEMKYWEIIAFSYSTFPETTLGSEIKPEFKKTRLTSAINLFKRQKISLKKAVSIAGISVESFEKELIKKQIHPYELNEDKYNKSLKLIENIT